MFIYNKAACNFPNAKGDTLGSDLDHNTRVITGTSIYLEPCRHRSIFDDQSSYFLAFPRTLYKIYYNLYSEEFDTRRFHCFYPISLRIGWVLTDDITANTFVYPPALKNVGLSFDVCQDMRFKQLPNIPLLESCTPNEEKKTIKIPKSVMMYPLDLFWNSSFNDSLTSCYDLFRESQTICSFEKWEHTTRVNPNWYPYEKDFGIVEMHRTYSYDEFSYASSLEKVEVTIENDK